MFLLSCSSVFAAPLRGRVDGWMADAPAPTSSLSPFARDRAAAGATRAPPAQRASPRRERSALTYC